MLEPTRKRKRLSRLTLRELDVLQLLLQGCSNNTIAERLSISKYTARDHVSALLKKSGVTSRAQLVSLYVPVSRSKLAQFPLHLTDCGVD